MKILFANISPVGLIVILLATAKPMDASADTISTTTDVVRAFWSHCQREVKFSTASDFFRVRHFGQDARIADLLVNLIAIGQKTGTFTSPWLFEGNPEQTPVVGGYTVVTNFIAEPRLLLRTIAVSTMPFDEISEKETAVDGPAVRKLEVWRNVHWGYFGRELRKLDRTPALDMPITIEKFEVVCIASALL